MITPHLLPLAAGTLQELDSAATRLAGYLHAHPAAPLADVAFTLRRRLGSPPFRRCVAARSAAEAAAAFATPMPSRARVPAVTSRRVAFLFPGLGENRFVGAAALYRDLPSFRAAIDGCAPHLAPDCAAHLRSLVEPAGSADAGVSAHVQYGLGGGPLRALPTRVAHPVMFAVSWAVHELWRAAGVAPAVAAGYSLGEYTAAAAAGVFSFGDALGVVSERARLADGLPPGAMTAVALPAEQVDALCKATGAAVAALNGKAVTVAAGTPTAIQALEKRLDGLDAVYRRIDACRAFHTQALAAMAPRVAQLVASVPRAVPRIPLFSNVSGGLHDAISAGAPGYWAEHVVSPVRMAAALEQIGTDPTIALLQVGPGAELARLGKAASAGARGRIAATSLPEEGDDGTLHWLGELGRLWASGVDIRWESLASSAAAETAGIELP